MYANIYCYRRVEINRPPLCVDVLRIEKQAEEALEDFRVRVSASFNERWRIYPWDSVHVEVFT